MTADVLFCSVRPHRLFSQRFKIYWTDRDCVIEKLDCGVLQGWILGRTLFNANVLLRHDKNFHSYADDTQVHMSMCRLTKQNPLMLRAQTGQIVGFIQRS